MTLEGPQVLLRPYRLADAEAIHRWKSDPDTTRWMGSRFRTPPTWEQTLESLRRVVETPPPDGVFFAIADRLTGDYRGGIDLTSVDLVDRRAVLSLVIGREEDRGRGWGQQAVGLLADYAFGPLGLHRISLTVAAENTAARRCYLACGFVEEGTSRDHSWVEDRWVDQILMARLAPPQAR